MSSYPPMLLLFSVLTAASAAAQNNGNTSRICLAPASVKETSGNAAGAMDAVRESFTSFLTGPSLSVAPLKARLESQVREEAKLAGCPFVLFTSVNHKRKQGSSLLGRAASGALQQGAWRAGSVAGSAVGSMAASAAAGAASAAVTDWTYTVRTKDELSLDYRLEADDGTVLVERKGKRKAESDGEDLLTPQVEQAAQAIANVVSKRAR